MDMQDTSNCPDCEANESPVDSESCYNDSDLECDFMIIIFGHIYSSSYYQSDSSLINPDLDPESKEPKTSTIKANPYPLCEPDSLEPPIGN